MRRRDADDVLREEMRAALTCNVQYKLTRRRYNHNAETRFPERFLILESDMEHAKRETRIRLNYPI